MKFLVVDDHELIREAMRAALAELDAEAAILEASDSREAMRLIEENADLDLILLDLTLPDRDGFSLLSELRQSHPGISVVVMSARQDHDSVMKALNQGALGFIPKSAITSASRSATAGRGFRKTSVATFSANSTGSPERIVTGGSDLGSRSSSASASSSTIRSTLRRRSARDPGLQ